MAHIETIDRVLDGQALDRLRRCTCCILPETMPFIEYDDNGKCNYCHAYRSADLLPLDELTAVADGIRRTDGKQDCIVMFSGGRDSSYLLHYVVTELGLHPLVFTYDWGMSTPIAERNAKKMCEKLGVERVIVDQDAKKKLRNVRRNVHAWCKRPDLGMVPLFMAGDKQFFLEVNKVAKQRGINTVFIGTNPLEKTDFKAGFCGVKPNFDAKQIHSLTGSGKRKMIGYYLKQYLKNPAYINASLWDTVKAFFSFYDSKQEQIDLYKYIRWDEAAINDLLITRYGWETDAGTTTTWRIGDGTAAFYNYIYYIAAGFTENDTLRSNQIREGMLTRDEALMKAHSDNQPRYESMRWYFDRIGLDMDEVLAAVRQMPRKY